MSTRRLSNIENQPEILRFVGKDHSKSHKEVSSTTSTPRASPCISAEKSSQKKRARKELSSPEDSAERRPAKKPIMSSTPVSDNKKDQADGEGEQILKPELQELKRQLFAGFEQLISSQIEPLKEDIRQLKAEKGLEENSVTIGTISRRFQRNDEKQKKIEERLSVIEDQLLEKNLIFQGLYETEYEEPRDVKGYLIRAMAHTMPGEDMEERKTQAKCTSIDQVDRIGRYNPQKTRPVKVKFTNKDDVDQVLRNRRKLPEGIYVEREYSKTTERERTMLRPILKAARKMDKYYKKCRMEGAHVVLDGKHYYRDNIHTLPPELAADKVTSKTNSEVIAFFGELHPLSNFHRCEFIHEGETYYSAEQLIQHKKAIFFEDKIAQKRIMNSTDPLDCKEIAKDIKDYDKDKWNREAETICYEGIREKFEQNEELKNYLLDTGNKTLVEGSYDNVWGTGEPLSSKDCLNPLKWSSAGILGRILMKIRDTTYEADIGAVAAESSEEQQGSANMMEAEST